MPYRRQSRRRMVSMTRPIVQSVKNQTNTAITPTPNSLQVIEFAQAVDVGAATKVFGNEVPTGAMVYSVDVYVNAIVPSGSGNTSFGYYICKTRGGQIIGTDFPAPNFSDIGQSDVRNQIFHSDMVLLGTEDAGPLRRKLHVKIPKIYQRMRAGDKLNFVSQAVLALSTDIGFRYKYYQ